MGAERFINGKHDDAAHDGRYSNTKREQEATAKLLDFDSGIEESDTPLNPSHLKPNRLRQAQNLARFTGIWRNSYYENGIKNPLKRIDEETMMINGTEYTLPKKKK